MLRLFGLAVLAILATIIGTGSRAVACPFCAAVSQTLRQEMESMDAVAIAELIPSAKAESGEIDGQAKFRILKVLRGDKLIKDGQEVTAAYFGAGKSEKHFLLMGVDPPQLLWSSPLPITSRAEEYIAFLPSLPKDQTEKLLFFQKYLEDVDSLLARDAYDEFAMAPYADVKAIKPHMNRQQLLKWVQDSSLSPDRKRLYFTMLGICGEKSDSELLEKMMRSSSAEVKAGLDAMIACYLTLRGADGLPMIDELFLKNPKCSYAEIYSAIMALRFHGTDGGILERKQIVSSMHHILNRADLADLVIPDLARWEDWSQIDRMVKLFKDADADSSWVRVPVVNYLRACPLPAAQEKLAELEKIDPAAVKRATTFFPIPPATVPGKKDSSSLRPNGTSNRLAAVQESAPKVFQARGTLGAAGPLASMAPLDPPSLSIAMISPPQANPLALATVISLASVTLGLSMWLVISGSGRRRIWRSTAVN